MKGIPALIVLGNCPGVAGSARTAIGIAFCASISGAALLGPPRKAVIARCGSPLEWQVIGPPELLRKINRFTGYLTICYVCQHQVVGD